MKRRCKYHCTVEEVEGSPSFTIRVDEEGFEDITFREKTPKGKCMFCSVTMKVERKKVLVVEYCRSAGQHRNGQTNKRVCTGKRARTLAGTPYTGRQTRNVSSL